MELLGPGILGGNGARELDVRVCLHSFLKRKRHGKEFACNLGDSGLIPGSGRSPGKGNGNPFQYSTLAWKIPWMEEPGGLQSMGPQRVGHDWATSLSLTFGCPVMSSSFHLSRNNAILHFTDLMF